jgi:two-component system cell cycle sensor histidine kinase/response regulator CckA
MGTMGDGRRNVEPPTDQGRCSTPRSPDEERPEPVRNHAVSGGSDLSIAQLLDAVLRATAGEPGVYDSGPDGDQKTALLTRALHAALASLDDQGRECQRLWAALRENEERYRRLQANIPGMVYTARLAEDGSHRFDHASPESRDLFDLEPEDLVRDGTRLSGLIHPDDQVRRDTSIEQSARTLQPWRQELRHIVNGQVRWYDCMSRPELGPDGRILWDGIILEITERKRAEEALRLSEAKYRRLHESMSDAFCRIDMSGRLVETNPAYRELLGYPQAELEGLSYQALTPEKWHELEAQIVQEQVMVLGCSQVYDKEYRRKDGTLVPVELRTFLMRDDAGIPVGMWAIVRDISERIQAQEERRKLEAQVLQAQKLESLGVLAGGIAHDFNNLLTAILGHADLALQDLPPVASARAPIEEVVTASVRAAELCRQMLTYSGQGCFVYSFLDLSEVVREMAQMLQVSVSKMALLRYELAHDLPAVRADATQIRQVIMNLILNASEAIGSETGLVTLRTGCLFCDANCLKSIWIDQDLPPGQYVYLEVSDTGCGMDASTLSKIFDPFFTTKFTGRGLGLAAVLGIVRGHQGALQVNSQPSCGTVFKVLLPVSERPVGVRVGSRTSQRARTGATDDQGCVLLVDDEPSIRHLGERMLKRLGYSVLLADNGQSALDVYRQRADEIRVVILDLTMPQMGGDDTFRALRALNPEVRVLLSSGYTREKVLSRFAGTEPQGFVQKPYQLSELARALEQALAD